MSSIPRLTLFALIVSIVAFSGCATPQYNYQPQVTNVSKPPLNTEVKVNVGDEIVKQGRFVDREAIQLVRPIKIGVLGGYTLSPGYYVKTGQDEDSEFYVPEAGPEGGVITKGAINDPWKSVQLMNRDEKIYVVTVFHAKIGTSSTGSLRRARRMVVADDSFQQTLIYSGKVGNKIKLGYREFSNNVARPAFNNDVEYDLNESKMIGYKGARIEVLQATNEFIRYRVIQNFNQAAY